MQDPKEVLLFPNLYHIIVTALKALFKKKILEWRMI